MRQAQFHNIAPNIVKSDPEIGRLCSLDPRLATKDDLYALELHLVPYMSPSEMASEYLYVQSQLEKLGSKEGDVLKKIREIASGLTVSSLNTAGSSAVATGTLGTASNSTTGSTPSTVEALVEIRDQLENVDNRLSVLDSYSQRLKDLDTGQSRLEALVLGVSSEIESVSDKVGRIVTVTVNSQKPTGGGMGRTGPLGPALPTQVVTPEKSSEDDEGTVSFQ